MIPQHRKKQSGILKRLRKLPWLRLAIIGIALLLIATGVLLSILGKGFTFLTVLGTLVGLFQWIFPIHTRKSGSTNSPSSQPTQIILPVPQSQHLSQPLSSLTQTIPLGTIEVAPSPPPLPDQQSEHTTKPLQADWSEAPHIGQIYGRKQELDELEQWILKDHCRLVTVIGIGGIGKTTLVEKLVEQIKGDFEYIIWRSTLNAPPLENIYTNSIIFSSYQQRINFPKDNNDQIRLILNFLREHRCLLIFDNLETILQAGDRAGHYREGSELEKEIMYWLAIEREAVSQEDIEDIMHPMAKAALLETLGSLRRRSVIETDSSARFTLQPVIMEYLVDRFVKRIVEEIELEKIGLFGSHALIKAQAKDYVRESQVRLILMPIAQQLAETTPKEEIEKKLKNILSALRNIYPNKFHYVAGNVLNLLVKLQYDLRGYDLSHQIMWQVYLQHANLPQVDFREAQFKDAVFADSFGSVLSIAFSPDDNFLAVGTSHSEIRLWETRDYTPLQSYYGHTGWVWAIDFHPSGKYLVSGSGDATVCIWNVDSGQNLKTLEEHIGWVRSVTFNQDGTMLASGGDDGTIKLWEFDSEHPLAIRLIRTLIGHESYVRSIAFSPDGTLLASGSEDQTVRIWNVSTGECVETLKGHQSRVRCITFSPDGKLLASCGEDRYLIIWNVNRRQEYVWLLPPGVSNRVDSLTFRPDGEQLAVGEWNGKIWIWNINKAGQPFMTLNGHTSLIRSVTFSTDGNLLASGGEDQTLRIWDTREAQCLKVLQGFSNWMWSIAFGPDKNIIVSGGEDKTLRLWNANTGECIKTMYGHTHRVWTVAFNPSGNIIASGSEDHTIRFWKASNGQHLKTLFGHTNRVRSLAFSPNGFVLASGSEDQMIRIWNVNNGDCLRVLEGHQHMIWSIAFSPNGRIVASGGADKTIWIWDAETGVCLHTLSGHSDAVRAVAFNEDGSLLASGSSDCTVQIWDMKSQKCRSTLEGHKHQIYSVAFSPDGRYLASGSHDHTVKVWATNTGQCLHTLKEHTNPVWSVSFSGDRQKLASCSEDGTIRIWDINTGQCLKVISIEKPYEGMQISGAEGLTSAQKETLRALGAKEDDF